MMRDTNGRRPPGIADIARRAGVARSTVSRALNGNLAIAAETRKRIARIAEELGYAPNYLAKGLAGRATHALGLMVPDLRDSFYVELLAAMESCAKQSGYSSILEICDAETYEERRVTLERLNSRFVDGAASATLALYEDVLVDLAKGLPPPRNLALYGDCPPQKIAPDAPVDVALCNLQEGMRILTRHLIELGHRQIAYIGGGEWKAQGYLQAMEAAGIQPDPNLMVRRKVPPHEAAELQMQLMSRHNQPTAIVAYRDDLAAELMIRLLESNYDIPEDISLVAINDSWHADKLRVPLTTLRIPTREIGEALVKMVIQRATDPGGTPRRLLFTPELIVRESTCPPAVRHRSP